MLITYRIEFEKPSKRNPNPKRDPEQQVMKMTVTDDGLDEWSVETITDDGEIQREVISQAAIDAGLADFYISQAVYEKKVELKETRSDRHTSLDAFVYEDARYFDDGSDLSGDLIKKLEYERVRKMVDRLKPKQRDVIKAVYFEGLSLAEYAARIGVVPSAVSHLLSRAEEKLKTFL